MLSFGLSICYDRTPDDLVVWRSPEFDFQDSSSWGVRLQPVPELLGVPSNALIEFRLEGSDLIVQDVSLKEAFEISILPSRGKNSRINVQSKGGVLWRGNTKIPYFRQVVCGCFLCFFACGDGPKRLVFEIPMTVEDKTGQGMMYRRMLKDVVELNPYLSLPTQKNMIGPGFLTAIWGTSPTGDTDVDHLPARLEKLVEDVDRVLTGKNALIRAVEQCPVLGQGWVSHEIPFGKVRNVTLSHVRQLNRMGLGLEDEEAGYVPVVDDIVVDGFDTRAHRAIKTYIEDVRVELERLAKHFAQLRQSYESKNSDEHAGNYYNMRIDLARELEKHARETSARIKERTLSRLSPWSLVKKGPSILSSEVRHSDFEGSDVYQRIYGRMYCYYMRKLWQKRMEGDFYLPEFMISDIPTIEKQQRQVDFLYESWVFVKLLHAFDICGFRMLDAYNKILRELTDVFKGLDVNRPVVALSEKGDLHVGLMYGVKECKKGGEAKTPDFAIEFTNVRTGERHVIILDAKATVELGEEEITKRDGYLRMSWRAVQSHPNQSWLVYLGETTEYPRIEFDYKGNKDDQFKFYGNEGLTWNGMDGIEGEWRELSQPVGHIRVNSLSKDSDNVFLEFVQGQINTVRRRLKLGASVVAQ